MINVTPVPARVFELTVLKLLSRQYIPGSSVVTPAGGNVFEAQDELLPGNIPGEIEFPETVDVTAELQNCSAVGYPYCSRSNGATPVLMVEEPKFSGW